MFKMIDSREMRFNDEIVLVQLSDGRWSIDSMSRNLVGGISQMVFNYWYAHDTYGAGAFMLDDLNLVVNGKMRLTTGKVFAGDNEYSISGVHPINIGGGVQRFASILNRAIPPITFNIVKYDIPHRSLRAYQDDKYVARIPIQ